jgi:hypothetical protein
MIDSDLCHEVLDLLESRTENIQDGIMVLLTCLRMVVDTNGVPPADAIEDFKQLFLSIEASPTSDSVN